MKENFKIVLEVRPCVDGGYLIDAVGHHVNLPDDMVLPVSDIVTNKEDITNRMGCLLRSMFISIESLDIGYGEFCKLKDKYRAS